MDYESTNNFNLLSLDFTALDDTENDTVEKDETVDANMTTWRNQFEYYRKLYIDNPERTSGKYIITEAARGPKSYLRSVSLQFL